MKPFMKSGFYAMLILGLTFAISGYATGSPKEKAPPKHGTYMDAMHLEGFTLNVCDYNYESGSGPMPPILRWSFKPGYSLSNLTVKMDAFLAPAIVWEDRQRSWCENAKVIRFRNYHKSFDKNIASRLCDKPYKSPGNGYIWRMSNSLS
jgi:hypothetical protein